MDSRALKVCLIGPLPPPVGGMANQTRLLRKKLESEGILVTMLASNRRLQWQWLENLRYLRALIKLIQYICRLVLIVPGQDVLHLMANSGKSWFLFAMPAILVARISRVPVVLNYRGGLAEPFFQRHWRFVAPSIRSCAQVVVPSPYLQRVFLARDVRVHVIPNLFDETGAKPSSMRHFRDDPRILVTRNLEEIYGIDLILEAFASLVRSYPAAVLVAAGDGPARPRLQNLADELGVSQHVSFVGTLTPSQVVEEYRKADILVNASRVDNSPNALVEALCHGVPVITSDAGGIPDLVTHGETALLFPVGDVPALASALGELCRQPGLRDALRQKGLHEAQRFHWGHQREALMSVYDKAMDGEIPQARTGKHVHTQRR